MVFKIYKAKILVLVKTTLAVVTNLGISRAQHSIILCFAHVTVQCSVPWFCSETSAEHVPSSRHGFCGLPELVPCHHWEGRTRWRIPLAVIQSNGHTNLQGSLENPDVGPGKREKHRFSSAKSNHCHDPVATAFSDIGEIPATYTYIGANEPHLIRF